MLRNYGWPSVFRTFYKDQLMIKRKFITTNINGGSNTVITHNLGKKPRHVFIWTSANEGINLQIVGRTTTTITVFSVIALNNVEVCIIAYN